MEALKLPFFAGTGYSEIESVCHDLSSVSRQLPKHNILIFGGDFVLALY